MTSGRIETPPGTPSTGGRARTALGGLAAPAVLAAVLPVVLGAWPAASCGGPAPAEAPRHVVFVSLDTLRADYVGCYGHPFVKTPTLDGLAAEGVRFTRCIATASTTLASHTSLFTGTYPHTHGVVSNGHTVPAENVMLAEVLTEAGFRCAGFAGAVPLDPEVGFDQGFEHYDAEISGSGRYGRHQRPANEVTDLALGWLDGRERAGAADERLFLFVHYYDVHWPYTPPEPYIDMYRDPTAPPLAEELDGSGKPRDPSRHLRTARRVLEEVAAISRGKREPGFAERVLADAERGLPLVRALEADYAAGVTWTDAELGRLLAGLAERGILDEALVVVTSDHGETLAEHGNVVNHGASVYDTEVHVPLLVRLPGGRHAGRVVERLTSGVDVLPTVLALLGLPAPDAVEGEDVTRALAGRMPTRAPVFAEATKPTGEMFNDDPAWPNRGKFQCVRTESDKYMFRLPDEQFRYYDLEQDPAEAFNLLLEEGDADDARVAELEELLRAWRDDVRAGGATDMLESQREGLEALGYGGADD